MELVYKSTTVEPMVVQGLEERNTLLVFVEGENMEKICRTLWSIKIWLGHSENTGCNVATPKQMTVGEWLHWVGREKSESAEGTNTQLPRLMPEPQHNMSCPCVASQAVGKMPKFNTFSRDFTQKGEVSIQSNGPFEIRSVMQSHTEATFREGIVQSLCGAMADLIWYLDLQALVAEIINKLELVYGIMASFDILMKIFYKLQHGKAENVMLYVTQLEGALTAVQQEFPMMLSLSEVQNT